MLHFLPILILAAAQSAVPADSANAQVRQIIQDCDAHRFETVVSAEVDGVMKSTKMKLCGVHGQSDSEWLKTLQDSAAKIDSNQQMPKPMRDAMVAALNNEVSRLKIARAVSGTGTSPVATNPDASFTLKPRAPVAVPQQSQDMRGYAALPPLPPPLKPGEGSVRGFVPPPPVVAPDLRFRCFSTESITEDECYMLDRYSVVVVEARSPVAPDTTLSFVLNGEEKASVDIGGMAKGQKRRVAVPAGVCRGVASGRLELQTMVMPKDRKFGLQRASSEGPFPIHCA